MIPQRLRTSSDVRAVFAARRVVHGSALAAHALLRDDAGPARVAVVAGRKVGPAVLRNRAKRRLRAALQQVDLPAGFDLVVVARSGALTEPFPALVEQVAGVITRLHTGAAA
jgi:ribonuclease P protein component